MSLVMDSWHWQKSCIYDFEWSSSCLRYSQITIQRNNPCFISYPICFSCLHLECLWITGKTIFPPILIGEIFLSSIWFICSKWLCLLKSSIVIAIWFSMLWTQTLPDRLSEFQNHLERCFKVIIFDMCLEK